MTPLIKFFAGVGVVTPVAGTLGGALLATSKPSSINSQVKQVEKDQRSQTTSLMDMALSPTVSHSSDTDHSQKLIVEGPESDLQETSFQVASIPEVSAGQKALTPEDSSKETLSDSEVPSPDLREDSATELPIQEQHVEDREVETGNCTIVNPFTKIIAVAEESVSDYYSVSCDSKGIEGGDYDTISNQWEGIFPKTIFKNKELKEGKKLEIKMKEEEDILEDDEDYVYKIKFSSDLFEGVEDSKLEGKWKDFEEADEDEKAVAKVKLINSNIEHFVYLLWNK